MTQSLYEQYKIYWCFCTKSCILNYRCRWSALWYSLFWCIKMSRIWKTITNWCRVTRISNSSYQPYMDKVKINSVNWKLVNATPYIRRCKCTIYLSQSQWYDGIWWNILISNSISTDKHTRLIACSYPKCQTVADSVGSEFGIFDGVIVQSFPEAPVDEETGKINPKYSSGWNTKQNNR